MLAFAHHQVRAKAVPICQSRDGNVIQTRYLECGLTACDAVQTRFGIGLDWCSGGDWRRCLFARAVNGVGCKRRDIDCRCLDRAGRDRPCCGGWFGDTVGQGDDFIAAQRDVSVDTVKGRKRIRIYVKSAGNLADSFATTRNDHLIIRIRNHATIVRARPVCQITRGLSGIKSTAQIAHIPVEILTLQIAVAVTCGEGQQSGGCEQHATGT